MDDSIGIAVGWNGSVVRTKNGGNKWEYVYTLLDNVLYSTYFVNADTGWAVGSGGIIIYSTNRARWFLPQNSGVTEQLQSVFFINSQTGWIVGSQGTVLYTTKYDAEWTTQFSST